MEDLKHPGDCDSEPNSHAEDLYQEFSTMAASPSETLQPEIFQSLELTNSKAEARSDSRAIIETNWVNTLSRKDLERAKNVIESDLQVKTTTPTGIAHECKRLLERLESEDYHVREKAKEVLAKIGPAALPALIRAMGSDDANIRRESTRLSYPLLRPARILLEQHAQLQNLENMELAFLPSSDDLYVHSAEINSRRLALRKPLLQLPDRVLKEEMESLSRLKHFITALEANAVKCNAHAAERKALSICKQEIGRQEDMAKGMTDLTGTFTIKTAWLMARDPKTGDNQIDVKVVGDLVKRSLSLGTCWSNIHVNATMKLIVKQCGDKPPADLLNAFKKAGGIVDSLYEGNSD